MSEDNAAPINSPADLYALVKTTPKSILKTHSDRKTTTSRRVQCASREDRQQKKVNFVSDSSRATSAEEMSSGGGQKSPKRGQDSEKGGHSAVSEEEQAEMPVKFPVQVHFCCCGLMWFWVLVLLLRLYIGHGLLRIYGMVVIHADTWLHLHKDSIWQSWTALDYDCIIWADCNPFSPRVGLHRPVL